MTCSSTVFIGAKEKNKESNESNQKTNALKVLCLSLGGSKVNPPFAIN